MLKKGFLNCWNSQTVVNISEQSYLIPWYKNNIIRKAGVSFLQESLVLLVKLVVGFLYL